MKMLNDIKKIFCLDLFSILLYFAVSLSFPTTYKYSIIAIIILSLIQIYRLTNKKISQEYISTNYFFLLIFSLIFFRSVHSLILIFNIFFSFFFFLKNKPSIDFKKKLSGIYIIIFFIIILLNGLIHKPFLKGLDTYLYLLFYPIFFVLFDKDINKNIIERSIRIYISSVILSIIYLGVINFISGELRLATNTYFSNPLGLIHVYYGIYLGLAATFILMFNSTDRSYVSRKIDKILFLVFLLLLIYIGARISLIAVIFLSIVTLYKKLKFNWYKKIFLIGAALIGLLFVSYLTIPRARDDIKYVKRIYQSIKLKNKEDLIQNSWRNMYQRYLVMDYSIVEVKENYMLGIGINNVKDDISDKILKDGYLYFKPMNSHNQYLHFLLGLGVVGFLYFLFLIYHFYMNNLYGNYFLVFFLIVMITESVLVRVKGISLFFLFFLILVINKKKS